MYQRRGELSPVVWPPPLTRTAQRRGALSPVVGWPSSLATTAQGHGELEGTPPPLATMAQRRGLLSPGEGPPPPLARLAQRRDPRGHHHCRPQRRSVAASSPSSCVRRR